MQGEVAAARRTRFDVFDAELHDVVLEGFRDTGRVRLSDADPAFRNSPDDNDLQVYELLTSDRYALFVNARTIARELGVVKVWHANGAIYVRRDNGSRSVRVTRLADLDKLRKD